MILKYKKTKENAVAPQRAHATDAGMDLTAASFTTDYEGNYVYGIGLAFEIPNGYVGYIYPRSSVAKRGLMLTNGVGVIDSGYRGEVLMKFRPMARGIVEPYKVGERIGQLVIMPYPQIELEEVDELSASDRGEGGYGSSGK